MDGIDTPREASFATGTRLFVGILAVAHAVAFGSIWVQSAGLIGPSGILPAGRFFAAAHEHLGSRAWFEAPSLCWVFGAGRFIDVLCGLGIGLALLLLWGFAPAVCLALLWACYLSLVSAGQAFFDFQWDLLLLESTLVAIFLVPWTLGRTRRPHDPPRLARYLIWWLLFRLMFFFRVVNLTGRPRPQPTPAAPDAAGMVCPAVPGVVPEGLLRGDVRDRAHGPAVHPGAQDIEAHCRPDPCCVSGRDRPDRKLRLLQSARRRALPHVPG